MLRFFCMFIVMAVVSTGAWAVTVGSNSVDFQYNVNDTAAISHTAINADDAAKLQVISTLENDISLLQAELKKCEKGKKGWIAATVIGSAGVVATGVAAGVQGAQLSKKKTELKTINADVASKKQELNSINNGEK